MKLRDGIWAGIDVGAKKGFDVAVIDRQRVVAGPARLRRVGDVVRSLREQRPRVVAVDSPRVPAPDGELSRRCERELVRSGVCGIRYTPSAKALDEKAGYYAWIRRGFELYAAVAAASSDWEVIECFPTATWSRLGGRKGCRSRAAWSSEALSGVGLRGLPRRMSQDARDAVGAALTARLYEEDATQSFGEIVVPLAGGAGVTAPRRRRPGRR